MPHNTGTRQLILEAALACIEASGLERLTIRRIALKAGTNTASINYYFRSKEHLVSEVFSMTIQHMLEDVFTAIKNPTPRFQEVLTDVLFYLLDGSLRFPGITRAHLERALKDSGGTTTSGRAMEQVFQGLTQRASLAYPSTSKAELQLRVAQVLAGVLFMILKSDFFDLGTRNRLTSAKRARALAESYTHLFLAAMH